jgi:hypothetical protein
MKTYNNKDVATKLIKTVSTSFLTTLLLVLQAEAEEINDEDRKELEQLLDQVVDGKAPETPVMVHIDEVA